MAAPRVDRRLAAVLAADVVGYSRLMQRDEQGTLERLRAHRKDFVEPLVAEQGGRVVKLMGDGLLCEFGSAVDAVRCAVLVQQGMAEREAGVPVEDKVRLRIGINLGDVIHEDGDVYGDGVNIAARLEALADPGGVCIARNIHNQVKGKLAFRFAPMGPQRLKNIAEPIETWRVLPDGNAARATPTRRRPRFKPALAAALTILLLIGAGAGGWWWYQAREPAQAGGSSLPAKPSIAVLPLANLSDEARWERLADGITEDLITDLARDPDLLVIARNSTLPYKGKAVDVREVAKDLGVRYVLEGSLQAAAGRVRVTSQLIDATTGGHLWAERYDRPEADLFAIQDEVAQNVAGALGGWYGRLNEARRAEARRRPPASLEAYDLYLLGLEQKHEFTKASMEEAIRSFSRAVELDSGFARGWTMLGLAYGIAATSGFVDDPLAANRLAIGHIKKAAELDPFDPFTQAMLGGVRALEGDLKGAGAALDRALVLAPNDASTLTVVAWNLPLIVGRADEAVRLARRAMALDPASPAVYAPALAVAQYAAGEYEETVATVRRAPLEGGETLMHWAMAQAQLGHVEEARKAAERIRAEFPSFTVEGYIRDFPVTAPGGAGRDFGRVPPRRACYLRRRSNRTGLSSSSAAPRRRLRVPVASSRRKQGRCLVLDACDPAFSLDGRKALVTGASRGIGEALAVGLARFGADVAVAARDAARLAGCLEAIATAGRRAVPLAMDVRSVEAVREGVGRAAEALGGLDILVNNAGVEQVRPSLEVDEALWDRLVDTNLKGAFFAAQAAARVMQAGGGGTIVNVCSLTSEVGVPTAVPYGSSKSGLLGMTRALAAEWAPLGVRVNAIGPGYFRTELTEAFYRDEGWASAMLAKIPAARFGDLRDLVGSTVFLCSDAARYVTGQILYVDGGYMASI